MTPKRKNGAIAHAWVAALLVTIAGAGTVQAQQDMEAAVEVRQSILKLVRWNIAPLGAMARGRAPLDIEQVETNAARIESLMGMMGDAFATDTRGADVETEALDRIWEDRELFAEKISATREAAAALVAAAQSGDEDDAKAAIGSLAQTCGSCHDDFRVD